jgi:peptidoglycan/LPS O-acetylase OafA/YrhL
MRTTPFSIVSIGNRSWTATPPSQGAFRSRSVEIDSLRAFAVLLVLWTHTVGTTLRIGEHRIGGYHGVLLFFVISGFLITDILLGARSAVESCGMTRGGVLRAFYARRFLRICPVYYAVLVVAWVVGYPDVRASFGWHIAYLSNWHFAWHGEFGRSTAHLWSLAVEEQFYLVWPWFALLAPGRVLPRVIGAMILAGPVSRLLLDSADVNRLATWTTTPTVTDALGLGCLLAYAGWKASARDRMALSSLIAGLLLGGLSQVLYFLGIAPSMRFAINPLAWAFVFVWLVHQAAVGVRGVIGKFLRARPFVFLGTISYGVYLMHLFIVSAVIVCESRLGLPSGTFKGVLLFTVVTVIAVSASALSWRFFEAPINSLKDRFPYVPRTRTSASGLQATVD